MKKPSADFVLKISIIAVLAFIVINFATVNCCVEKIKQIFQPIIVGIVLALAMSVPLNFFEGKVYSKIRREKVKKFLSLGTTFLIFSGAIAVLAILIIPQGVKSVKDIIEGITSGELLSSLKDTKIYAYFGDGLKKIYEFISRRITEYLPQIIDFLQGFFTGLYNVLFGIIIAIMLLVNRQNVKSQLKKIIFVLFKDKNMKVHGFLLGAVEKFSKYLGGQLTEAFILGGACYITMLVLKVPYASLVSLIIGFSNLIPIFGAYVGGAVCFILVFAVNPSKAIIMIIAIIVLQQIEGFTTYPIIVGKYVGLNGFWITVSVILWGGIFGFWGVFLGVPLSAFLFDLFEKFYHKKFTESRFTDTLTPK